MIRVRLQSSRRALGRVLGRYVFGAGVVLAALVGAARIVDEHYPLGRLLRRWAWPPSTTATDVDHSQAAVEASLDHAPRAPAPSAVGGLREGLPPAGGEHRATAPPPDQAGAAGAGELLSTSACRQASGLTRHLPRAARLTSLSGRADGAYAIEGLVPAEGVVELLDSLDALPATSRLSYWRGGQVDALPYYKFIFDGHLASGAHTPLSPVLASQVAALTDEVSRRARQCGLSDLRLDEAPPAGERTGTGPRRYKCWATGAMGQIRAFLAELSALEETVAVGEVLVVPRAAGQPGALAQLYAGLDIVVAGQAVP